jgi:hypothetical protein
VTVPIVVILALVFGLGFGGGSGSGRASTAPGALPALTPSAPPSNPAAVKPCTTLLEHLPIHVGTLAPRAVHPKPDSLFVLAWGDPPVLLRCGVARPADLRPGSSAQFFQFGTAQGAGGVYFDVTSRGSDEVYTTVDRAVYIQIIVPSQYHSAPVVTLAGAIAKALPPVCVGGQAGHTAPSKLCTHRK